MDQPKWWCFECKANHDHVLMDGYPFGDRLLEGVMFVVKKKPDGSVFTEDVNDESKPYFEDLNQTKWIRVANEYAAKRDLFTCHVCGEDIAPTDKEGDPDPT